MTSTQAIELITKVLSLILVPAVTLLASMLANYFHTRTRSIKTQMFIHQVSNIVCNVVAEVNQTFVDELKKEGAFDKLNALKAAQKAMALAKAQIGSEGMKLLDTVMEDGNAYLKSLIEFEVREQKGRIA